MGIFNCKLLIDCLKPASVNHNVDRQRKNDKRFSDYTATHVINGIFKQKINGWIGQYFNCLHDFFTENV